MDLSSYNFAGFYSGWWTRQPVDVSGETSPKPAPANGDAQTGMQTRFGVPGVVGVTLPCPPAPIGDYPIWRAMDCDPALVMSRAVITAPISEAEIAFEAREGAPEQWVKAVQAAILPLWPGLIRDALDALSMGWKPFEVPFGRRNGLTVPVDFKPLAQELTVWLHRKGVFAGLRNTGPEKIDLPPARSLVITCGGHNRDPYGIPWHENARETWWRKVQCIADLTKVRRKASGMQGQMYFPPAADEETAHTNEIKAREVLNAYLAGNSALFPNLTGGMTADMIADVRNIKGLAEGAIWKIITEHFGSIGPDHAAILAEITACNADLSRAWHVPERTAQEAKHGSRADSESSGNIAMTMSQLVFNDVCAALTQQVVNEMLVQNWGEAARDAVTVKAAKLRDVFSDGDWKIIDTVLANPDLSLAIAEQIDLDAVFTRRGIPKNKGVLTLADAIKTVQANRQKAQAAPQAEPPNGKPVNGNGRITASRASEVADGLALLGRISVDEHE